MIEFFSNVTGCVGNQFIFQYQPSPESGKISPANRRSANVNIPNKEYDCCIFCFSSISISISYLSLFVETLFSFWKELKSNPPMMLPQIELLIGEEVIGHVPVVQPINFQ
mgnify:CR=1 FL=1